LLIEKKFLRLELPEHLYCKREKKKKRRAIKRGGGVRKREKMC